MRGLMIVGALALILGGCLQRTNVRPATAERCDVTVASTWETLTVEAGSMGPNCEHAVATIALHDSNGVLWAQTYPAAHVMVLNSARSNDAMRTALTDWVNSSNNTVATSSALPEWPEGAAQPASGEFPFYVAEALSRRDYLALRERNVPVFCFVQGMESQNCLALENGIATEIGLQTFPG